MSSDSGEDPDSRSGLEALYNQFNGPELTFDHNWMSAPNSCDWTGVECDVIDGVNKVNTFQTATVKFYAVLSLS